MKQNKGITVIALVIAIIVMLILAGISINLVIGDNGAVSRSESARVENLRAQILERIKNETKASIDEFGKYDQKTAINNLIENYDESKIKELIVETNGRLAITYEEQGNTFKFFVSNAGEVTEVADYVYEKENAGYAIKSKIGSEEENAYDLLAPVPMGFVVSNSREIQNGLVIVEKNESEEKDEYIWIPVKEEDLNLILVSDENGDLYYYEKVDIDSKEYNILEPYFTLSKNIIETSDKITINNFEMTDKEFNMMLRKNFNNAIESVRKNGGFYILKNEETVEDKNWYECWGKQNNLKNKYNIKQEISTDMLYGFQVKMIKEFNSNIIGEKIISTQSVLLKSLDIEIRKRANGEIKYEFDYYEEIPNSIINDEKEICIDGGKIIDYRIDEQTGKISGNLEIYICEKESGDCIKKVKDSFYGIIDKEERKFEIKTEGFFICGIAGFSNSNIITPINKNNNLDYITTLYLK